MNSLLKLKQPQILPILLAQSIDTTMGLCLSILFSSLVLVFFSSQNPTQPIGSSGMLFAAAIMLFWVLNFVQRLFFISFLGATLGQYFTGVRACMTATDPHFWLGQAIECLHLIMPVIWLIETAQRMGLLAGSPFRGLRYMVLRQHPV